MFKIGQLVKLKDEFSSKSSEPGVVVSLEDDRGKWWVTIQYMRDSIYQPTSTFDSECLEIVEEKDINA